MILKVLLYLSAIIIGLGIGTILRCLVDKIAEEIYLIKIKNGKF